MRRQQENERSIKAEDLGFGKRKIPKAKGGAAKGRPPRPMEEEYEIKYYTWQPDGLAVKFNGFGVYIEINEIRFYEKDFAKLFPAKFTNFKVRKEWTTGYVAKKGEDKSYQRHIEYYFYVPIEMLKEVAVIISYRKLDDKLRRVIIDLTVDGRSISTSDK